MTFYEKVDFEGVEVGMFGDAGRPVDGAVEGEAQAVGLRVEDGEGVEGEDRLVKCFLPDGW